MKHIHYLAGLMLSIALVSCTNDQFAGADGSNQKEAKEQPKVEISVDAENAVIGLPGKAPMTRGNETITTKGDDITGYLQYQEGNKITTDLIIGMQVGDNGTKCFFHLVRSNEIKKSSERNYYIELKKDNLYNLSSNSGASGSVPVYSGDYESFKKEYIAHPDQLKAYVAAVVGGEFDAVSATSRFAPSMNCDPERNGYRYQYIKKGIDGNKLYDDKSIAFITPKNDAVEMDIPLTTDRWQEIGKGRITQFGEKWNIDLSDVVLDLKPSGSIVALTYKNTEVEERDYKLDMIRNPVSAWIDAIKIEKLNKDDNISFPIVAKVGFDQESWDGTLILNSDKDFVGWEKIYVNSSIGYMTPGNNSSPIYLWGTGRGEIKVTFFLTKLRETNQKDPNVPYYEGSIKIFDKNSNEIGFCYYPTQEYCTQFIKNFNGMESGKTYYAKFDNNYRREEEEKNGIGIIMTEYCVKGFKDNASKSMVEIYNPTDHSIDLRDYGFIRTIDYDVYLGDGSGRLLNGDFYSGIDNALVQELYMLLPRYGDSGNERKCETHLWNHTNKRYTNEFYDRYDNNGSVRYAPYLGPRQTAIFTGNFNLDKKSFDKGINQFEFPYVAEIKQAINNGKCLFIVGLKNGDGYEKKSMYHSSTLNCGWWPDNNDANKLNGIALIKRDEKMNWKIVDVLGVTIEDKELLENHNAKTLEDKRIWYHKAFGTLATSSKGPLFNYWKDQYYTNIVRNKKGEFANKQNPHFLRFENGQLKSVLGMDPDKDLWLVCPYNQNKVIPYSNTRLGYTPSWGKRF